MPNFPLGSKQVLSEENSDTTPLRRRGSMISSPKATQWRTGFWHNVRDFLKEPAYSQRSIGTASALTWPGVGQLTRAQGLSVVLHASLIVLLLIPAVQQVNRPPIHKNNDGPIFVPPFRWKAPDEKGADKNRGGGNGGAREPGAPTAGAIPPFAPIQLTPPGRRISDADLPASPTLLGPNFVPPQMPFPEFGDPRQQLVTGIQGPGGGNGIGTGCCGGIGDGKGRGFGPGEESWTGGVGEPTIAGRNGVGMPACVYCPNPTFTQEAINVKYQGNVTLWVLVTTEGQPTNIRLQRTAGLGLDERAIEAVRTWRFHPARDAASGKPVDAWVLVEVMFRQF